MEYGLTNAVATTVAAIAAVAAAIALWRQDVRERRKVAPIVELTAAPSRHNAEIIGLGLWVANCDGARLVVRKVAVLRPAGARIATSEHALGPNPFVNSTNFLEPNFIVHRQSEESAWYFVSLPPAQRTLRVAVWLRSQSRAVRRRRPYVKTVAIDPSSPTDERAFREKRKEAQERQVLNRLLGRQ